MNEQRFAPRLLAAVGLLIAFAAIAMACPFCSMQGQTLTGDVNQASMVVYGTLANAKLEADGGFGQGTTELHVEGYVKRNPAFGEPKIIMLPKYIPTDNNSARFLIFCDVYKGKIDPYRGVPIKSNSDLVKYLQGAMLVKEQRIDTRLRYFFDFLDSPDLEVANDAYKEFANADYKDYREMAKHLPPDKIAKWLTDPDTPNFRFGLYASMLGHCGTDRHAAVLRSMLDDPQKRLNSGVDGILAGYVMLKPKEGWDYVRGILKDPNKEFMYRFAALRAARFLIDSRPDLVPPQEVLDGLTALLEQADIADLAIEDLRKWHRWELAPRVLGLEEKKSHDIPIMHRTILRYALSCPRPEAAAFVESMRKKDPETVKDVEELLKLETPDTGGKSATPKAP
jgi:hypothetical protein